MLSRIQDSARKFRYWQIYKKTCTEFIFWRKCISDSNLTETFVILIKFTWTNTRSINPSLRELAYIHITSRRAVLGDISLYYRGNIVPRVLAPRRAPGAGAGDPLSLSTRQLRRSTRRSHTCRDLVYHRCQSDRECYVIGPSAFNTCCLSMCYFFFLSRYRATFYRSH